MVCPRKRHFVMISFVWGILTAVDNFIKAIMGMLKLANLKQSPMVDAIASLCESVGYNAKQISTRVGLKLATFQSRNWYFF